MKALLFIAVLAGCEAFEGSCETVEQTGPGMSGRATYTLGDGTQLETDLDAGAWADTLHDGFEVASKLTDEWGIERPFTVRVFATTPGTYYFADRPAAMCMVRQSRGESICSPLTGTLELRAHERDCYWHESGVGTCAETLEFTIAARSEWQSTVFTIDGDMLTEGMWVDDPDACAD